MNKQKALEVAGEILDAFGSALLDHDSGSQNKEYLIKIERTHYYQQEIQKLETICQKHGLGYDIEGEQIIIWEEDKND